MTKLLVAIFICLVSISGTAQGINFEMFGLQKALLNAQKDNKPVFIDCYTSWCGPCKMLSKHVFTQKKVGDVFNAKFVNVKINMEKAEGKEITKKYNIKAFPTLLFLDKNGKELHRVVGFSEVDQLLEDSKAAFDPTLRLDYLKKEYTNGNRNREFILKYLKSLYRAFQMQELSKVANNFLATLSELEVINEDVLEIIAICGVEYNNRIFNTIVKNKAKVIKIVHQDLYDTILVLALSNHLKTVKDTKSKSDFKSEKNTIKSKFGKKYLKLALREMMYIE